MRCATPCRRRRPTRSIFGKTGKTSWSLPNRSTPNAASGRQVPANHLLVVPKRGKPQARALPRRGPRRGGVIAVPRFNPGEIEMVKWVSRTAAARLVARDARAIARIVKVNHAGEFGAIRIYAAQIAVAARFCPDVVPALSRMLAHEREHCAAFQAAMPARDARPCRIMKLWSCGGWLLGFLMALLGDKESGPAPQPWKRRFIDIWTTNSGFWPSATGNCIGLSPRFERKSFLICGMRKTTFGLRVHF